MSFERYVDSIVRKLPCSRQEKKNIKEELLDHLYLLKVECMEEGYDDETSTNLAMQRFGDGGQIAKEICDSLPLLDNYRRKMVFGGFISYLIIALYLFLLSPERWARHETMLNWKKRMLDHGFEQYTHIYQNTIPLHTISDYIINYHYYSAYNILINLIGNVLLFVPLGLLLPLLFVSFVSIHRVFIASLLTSLAIESAQLLFNLGSFDVDDILLNTIGALIGHGLYRICMSIFQTNKKKIFSNTGNEMTEEKV